LVIHSGTLRNELRKQTGIKRAELLQRLQTGGLAAVDKALAQPYLCKT
jgi:hypothetical protein